MQIKITSARLWVDGKRPGAGATASVSADWIKEAQERGLGGMFEKVAGKKKAAAND